MAKLKPFDIVDELIGKSGRYCSVPNCFNPACVRRRQSILPFWGSPRRQQLYLCSVHYQPATAAKASA